MGNDQLPLYYGEMELHAATAFNKTDLDPETGVIDVGVDQ